MWLYHLWRHFRFKSAQQSQLSLSGSIFRALFNSSLIQLSRKRCDLKKNYGCGFGGIRTPQRDLQKIFQAFKGVGLMKVLPAWIKGTDTVQNEKGPLDPQFFRAKRRLRKLISCKQQVVVFSVKERCSQRAQPRARDQRIGDHPPGIRAGPSSRNTSFSHIWGH